MATRDAARRRADPQHGPARAARDRSGASTRDDRAIPAASPAATRVGHQFAALDVESSARGPFAPSVNALLTAAFRTPLDGISVERGADVWNDALGALASVHGRHVALGSTVREDASDPASMEVLAHEVAHALAGGGAGRTWLDRPGDAGELAADHAGEAMGAWVAGGATSAPPTLAPATGGQAVVHRFESGEHRHAVDDAVATLQAAGKGDTVRPEVAAMLAQPIVLANGVAVSPGQITALMGDFYGQFKETEDGRNALDPAASFEQMNNADPAEMRALLGALAREEGSAGAPPQEIPASEWERITGGRAARGGGDSYLELAKRNDSHFSGPEMSGTDNNMGTYNAFHALALQKAAQGDVEQARALEASAMHYLTDRHASGHSFEKAGVMEASGWNGVSGTIANLFAKSVHDDFNENGAEVSSANNDGSWLALGDGHWADEKNRENRERTSTSVTTSWDELARVSSGEASSEQLAKDGYAADRTVPQWDPERQLKAEQGAADENVFGALWHVADEAPDMAGMYYDQAIGSRVDESIGAIDQLLTGDGERSWLLNTSEAMSDDWEQGDYLGAAGNGLALAGVGTVGALAGIGDGLLDAGSWALDELDPFD